MKITLVQTSLIWENAEANRKNLSRLVDEFDDTDIIILPEMFSTGFTMKPEAVAETMDGPSVDWMRNIAYSNNCAVTGSLVVKEAGKYYNRLLFVFPDGTVQHYNKRHLFTLAGEHKQYTTGKERLLVKYKGWKICPLVCYDLRFPVYSRNTEDYDLLLYVANWPRPRILAWDTLLKARAIENMCYVAGVNRVGEDSNGHNYPGHSQVVDFLGKEVLKPSVEEGLLNVTLNKSALEESRNKFGFLNDRDRFILQD